MAGRIRTNYRSVGPVGATSLKPAIGPTTSTTRTDWRLPSRTKTQSATEPTRTNAIEGVAAEDKPLKKSPSDAGRRRKDKRHLRERRHGTGVVILPGGDKNDDQADEARQTVENTKQNESIGAEDFSPNPSEVSSSTPGRSHRIAHDDVDLDRRDKKDLLDRIVQLEKSLEQKTKEVESLKSEIQRLRDDNNALVRVVNQMSSLKTK